jgi:NAD(P)-dependent dehydrogenase (short-subunit alcohol dehydrogenase family)
MRLKGQSILVTGAARGVGAAIALAASREGAGVTAVDVNEEGLEALLAKAKSSALVLQTLVSDISTADGNAKAVSAAETRFGPLNTFIANAAVIRFADTLSTTEENWDTLHRVNLKGAYLGIQAALPSLRRSRGGSLILVASVLGMVGDPLLSAYGAAKGGLRALCRSMAVAHGAENIRCNTICPGDVETDMMRAQFALEADPVSARERTLSHYPLDRFATPQDVANAAIFLASDEANYITGTDLIVDGGLLSKCY